MSESGGEGDVAALEGLLRHGMTALGDGDGWFGRGGEECGFAIAWLSGDFGEGEEAVESGEGGDGISQRLVFGSYFGQEVFKGLVAGRSEGFATLITLGNETDDLGGVEAREGLCAGDLAPRGGDVLNILVGNGDEVFDACNGNVFDRLLFNLLCGDGAVFIEFVLDVGYSHLVILNFFGMELLSEEAVFIVLLGSIHVNTIKVGDDCIQDLGQGDDGIDD